MQGSRRKAGKLAAHTRPRAAVVVYGLLLAAGLPAVVSSHGGAHPSPVLMAALAALAVCSHLAEDRFRRRLAPMFDTALFIGLLAVAFGTPVIAFAIFLLADLIRLVHRGQAFWHSGLLANVVSYAAEVLAGSAVLALDPAQSTVGHALALLLAGGAMAAANYFFARLLFVALRGHEPLATLVRREFIALLPLELMVIGVAVLCSLLIPAIGVLALLGCVVLVYVPQAALERLVRAPSVAGLSVDAAAAVYRAALADELQLSRHDRRRTEQADALLRRRPLPGRPPENPLAIMDDALTVTLCTELPPHRAPLRASPRAQVIMLAREWAALTARCTPALTHHEALRELRASAPARLACGQALAAAQRIANRERALSEHLAGVPQLHRAPLPRRARQTLLPRVLAHLADPE